MFTSSRLLHYATKLYILQIFSIVNSTVQLFYILVLRYAISCAIMIAHCKNRKDKIMYSPKEIGDRIKSRRDELDMTLDEVAAKVGVSKSTIQRYENGLIGRIKLPVIESIADALWISPDWLVGVSEEKTADPKVDGLSPKENELLALYRGVNPDGQRYILQQAEFANSREEYRLSPAPTAKSGA